MEDQTPQSLATLPSSDPYLQQVQASSGRQKYQLILNAENSPALVQSLPAQEVFLLVKELGALDAVELIGLASPEQVTLCVDMDCWDGDQLDAENALVWLHLLLIQDEEEFLRLIDDFDFELLVMMVKKQLTVVSGLESLTDDDEDLLANRKRFDQVYECDYRNSDVAKLMEAFQDVLFRERQELYLRLMEAVRHEMDSALQEDVFQLRCGRLGDLGFVERFESRSLYQVIDPQRFDPQQHVKPQGIYTAQSTGGVAPGFLVTTVQPHDLLADVMAGGLNEDLAHELTFLLNRAMSADGVNYGEPNDVRETIEDVYHYLNLALGYLAGSDAGKATELFHSVYLQHLFQLGYSLTAALRQRARTISQSVLGPYLDGPDAAVITALCQEKPRFFNGLMDETRADQRPFATMAEVTLVDEELQCIDMLQAVFGEQGLLPLGAPEDIDLDGCVPDLGSELTLSEIFLTALAQRIMGRDFAFRPFPIQELSQLHATLTRNDEAMTALRDETSRWLESQAPGTTPFVHYCLAIWESELCELEADDLVPEYVGGLVLRVE